VESSLPNAFVTNPTRVFAESQKQSALQQTPAVLQVAVVVPTYNEADNILVLANKLHDALDGHYQWEMIVVDDDSRDGTADIVDVAAQAGNTIRCIRRIGRRGLSTAVIEGCLATYAPLIVVMDADLYSVHVRTRKLRTSETPLIPRATRQLIFGFSSGRSIQHDERIVPQMLEHLSDLSCDLVVATRYADGGSTGEWNKTRKTGSSVATWLARLATPADISDPMSGFFGIRRDIFLKAAPQLSGAGFKILLDIAASSPCPLRIVEVPYTFRLRAAGESKLSATVVFDYIGMIVEKRSLGWVPARFVLFGCTGLAGVAVHMTTLYLLNRVGGLGFDLSQAAAVVVAMTFNFLVNNTLTYSDRRLRGTSTLLGLIRFYLVCGTGALSNVGVADFVFTHGSGWFVSGLAGAFVASVFNFAMSSRYVWS